jgi:hypothetical protein
MVIMGLLGAWSTAAWAQTLQGTDALAADLCACMAQVDTRGSDASVNTAVKECLGSAVIRYPAAVNRLLARQPGAEDRAYALGRSLGSLLRRDCPGFDAVRVRLQQAQGAAPARRGTL